jgi:alkylation response protein AidB-like acyl-CoA dehydrogenase
MNFDFSDDQKMLKDQARKFLTEKCSTKVVRKILESDEPYDKALWKQIADMGWLGTAIPEEYGGLGLGHLELCVIAEELGRAVAPVPFSSSVYLATEAILLAGSTEQKKKYLPKLADGSLIGTVAIAEGAKPALPKNIGTTLKGGKVDGTKVPVPDGDVADFAVVLVRSGEGQGERSLSLAIVDLKSAGVSRRMVKTVDPSRSQAEITFKGANCRGRLGLEQARPRPRGDPDGVRTGRWCGCVSRHGEGLCAEPLCVRPYDRFVPGDQAQACRHVCAERTRAFECVFRRMGTVDECSGPAGGCGRRADQRDGCVP